jgi:hypothetical protein
MWRTKKIISQYEHDLKFSMKKLQSIHLVTALVIDRDLALLDEGMHFILVPTLLTYSSSGSGWAACREVSRESLTIAANRRSPKGETAKVRGVVGDEEMEGR